MTRLRGTILACALLTLMVSLASAEEKPQAAGGPAPMLVATAEVTTGIAEPLAEFVGTVYFARTAKVAAEVEGVVEDVLVDDGAAVGGGDRLVALDDDLLATEIEGTRAAFEQNEVDVVQARRDLERIANLYKEDAIAETEYESYQTRLRRFQKQSIVLKARLDKLLLEQKRKVIRAPFDGVVIETLVEAGEWVPAGGAVALVADNRSFEILVDIPGDLIDYLEGGRKVHLRAGGATLEGTFQTVIPRGDIATRTFSAKFRVKGAPGLVEGMEARARLPVAEAREGLLVPRDAVINTFGQDVVFAVAEGRARMHNVEIVGYSNGQVAISAPELSRGQQVIVKGNERVRDGQPVTIGD